MEDDLTLDEIYRIWRAKHPTDEELADSVAALNVAYANYQSDDPGVPAREALRATCERLGLVLDE